MNKITIGEYYVAAKGANKLLVRCGKKEKIVEIDESLKPLFDESFGKESKTISPKLMKLINQAIDQLKKQ